MKAIQNFCHGTCDILKQLKEKITNSHTLKDYADIQQQREKLSSFNYLSEKKFVSRLPFLNFLTENIVIFR